MSSAERLGDPFHDKESEKFVARYIERGPLALDKLSIQDDIVTYTTKDEVAHDFDALDFLASLSCHIRKPYESITRYYGRYSCRRRGERAKIATADEAEITETDYRREFTKSSCAACIKRIYEIDPLECHPRPDFDELSRVELGSKANAKLRCASSHSFKTNTQSRTS